MSARLIAVGLILPDKERRKGQSRVYPTRRDVLDSLRYWRKVRHACEHSPEQYALARETAMRPVRLPA